MPSSTDSPYSPPVLVTALARRVEQGFWRPLADRPLWNRPGWRPGCIATTLATLTASAAKRTCPLTGHRGRLAGLLALIDRISKPWVRLCKPP